MLFGKFDTLVIDQAGVFNRIYAGPDGGFNPTCAMRVRCYFAAMHVGLIDQCLHFFQGKLLVSDTGSL